MCIQPLPTRIECSAFRRRNEELRACLCVVLNSRNDTAWKFICTDAESSATVVTKCRAGASESVTQPMLVAFERSRDQKIASICGVFLQPVPTQAV